MGQGQGQGSQVGTLGTQGRVYAITPQTKLADKSVIQGTFLLFFLWARVLFDFGASHSFIAASYVKSLGLKVETLENPLHVSSSLGTRVSVDKICQDCELGISGILLTVDLRVMGMLEFDVVLGMDWLTAHRVVIDCDRRRVTAYTPDNVSVMFEGDKHDALPQAVYDSRWHRQLMSWLASHTLEDKAGKELGCGYPLPRIDDLFDQLRGVRVYSKIDLRISYH